jgi:hypothetical protein
VDQTAEAIAALIRSQRFAYTNEIELHGGLAEVLAGQGLSLRREVYLTAHDRVDLLVALPGRTLGIEVKIAGAAGNVRRQLGRYAANDQVDELMLITTVRRHLVGLGDEMGGKPLTRVLLRGGL